MKTLRFTAARLRLILSVAMEIGWSDFWYNLETIEKQAEIIIC